MPVEAEVVRVDGCAVDVAEDAERTVYLAEELVLCERTVATDAEHGHVLELCPTATFVAFPPMAGDGAEGEPVEHQYAAAVAENVVEGSVLIDFAVTAHAGKSRRSLSYFGWHGITYTEAGYKAGCAAPTLLLLVRIGMDMSVTLYRLEGCPYCERVVDRLDELGVEYHSVWVEAMHSLRNHVKDVSGQRQVPVLIDEEYGITMAESARILEFVDKTYAEELN